MTKGFYSIMLAQFLSSLADNALLIAAIALLTTLNEPAWMTPLLKLFFGWRAAYRTPKPRKAA